MGSNLLEHLGINVEEELQNNPPESLSFYNNSAGSKIKEKICFLMLQQYLITKGIDMIPFSKSEDGDLVYDYIVLGERSNFFPVKCQHKSSEQWIDLSRSKTSKKIINTYHFNLSTPQIETKYKHIHVFSFHVGRTIQTAIGPKYEFSIYFVSRRDLLKKCRNKKSHQLSIDPLDQFWIQRNGNINPIITFEFPKTYLFTGTKAAEFIEKAKNKYNAVEVTYTVTEETSVIKNSNG